jgi:hypothetical protein
MEKGEIKKSSGLKHLFHFLGFSKNEKLYVILYLQQKLNEYDYDVTISYDSSSPLLGAAFGRYVVFTKKEGMTSIQLSNNIIKNKEYINMDARLPCNCNVCSTLTIGDLFKFSTEKGFKTELYYYTSLHNINKYLEFKEAMENILSMGNLSVGDTLFLKKDLDLFKLIDNCFESTTPFKTFLQNKEQIALVLDEKEILSHSLF